MCLVSALAHEGSFVSATLLSEILVRGGRTPWVVAG